MMNPQSRAERWFAGALVVLLAAACGADDSSPKADSTLEFIQYKAPAGWKVTEGGERPARIFAAPDSNATQQAIIIMVLAPAQGELNLATAFEAAVKEVTSGGKVLESSEVTSSKTRQGFEALSRTVVTQSEGGQQVHARMVAAKVQNRLAGIYYLATSKDLYDQHMAEMTGLLQSISFADAPAAAAPANGEQLLARAREQYAKEVAGRRKPHTISGDILGLDGKPIANVLSYRVSVWGTTIAAERTRYGLEVDKNGHYEQQVPDGLYQVTATCVVEHSGHRLPVDLVWLDDRKVGVDQASASGIVRDFRMVISGLRPGEDPKGERAFFGGILAVNGPAYTLTGGSFSTRHPGAKVLLTITPQGPLLDGSRMDAVTIDIDSADLNYSSNRRNIPFGVYKASAMLVSKDGSKTPMQISRSPGVGYAESAEFFWESARDDPEHRVDPAIYLKD